MKPSENLVTLANGDVIDRSKVIFVPKEEGWKIQDIRQYQISP